VSVWLERLGMCPALVVRGAAVFLVVVVSGCAMQVSGVVQDASSGAPIGGAVLQAQDGRNRTYVTDPAGQYAVKTDSDTTTMAVTAPGYQTATVSLPSGDRFPEVPVTLERLPSHGAASPRGRFGQPLVRPIGQGTPSDAGRSGGGEANRLRDAQSLYDEGLISADEYRRLRTRIIDGD
jgi:hypothetical protein